MFLSLHQLATKTNSETLNISQSFCNSKREETVPDLGKKIFDKLHIFEEFSVWEGKVCVIYHSLTKVMCYIVIISLFHITSYNWTGLTI